MPIRTERSHHDASNLRDFWSKQTSSLHRSSTESFYRAKAVECASLMAAPDRAADCIDLGCGAGELLTHLIDKVRISTGIDYSESMLAQARNSLAGKPIELLNGDVFELLPKSAHEVWLTSGALNQYLEPKRLADLLDLFADHRTARTFYLFDCVDPLRLHLIDHGIGYLPCPEIHAETGGRGRTRFDHAKSTVRRLLVALRLAAGSFDALTSALPGAGMGYGFRPCFWWHVATARKLQVAIVSSQYYEYRYHVILGKQA